MHDNVEKFLAAQAPGQGQTQEGSTSGSDDNKDSGIQNQVSPKSIPLSDGRVAVVQKGKGRHAMMAQRVANGNQEKYLGAMISLLTTINGMPVVVEDLEELPLCDYLLLQAEFADQNF